MPADEAKPAGSTSPVAREKLEGMFACVAFVFQVRDRVG